MKLVAKIIGSTFGAGFFPIAPGTVGSLVAVIALWFIPFSTTGLLVASILFFLIGLWAATVCEEDWGHDPGKVVWDEVVGMMVTVTLMPKHWIIYAAAFVLFRLFDILKPFPANKSQALPKGWGVMVDDIIAALFANIVLHIIFRLIFPSFTS